MVLADTTLPGDGPHGGRMGGRDGKETRSSRSRGNLAVSNKKAPQRPQRLRARLEFYYLSKAKRLMASKRYDPPLFRDADGDLAGLPMRLLLLDQMPACQLRCAGEGQLSIALCAGERVLGRTSSCKRSRDVEACRDMFLQ